MILPGVLASAQTKKPILPIELELANPGFESGVIAPWANTTGSGLAVSGAFESAPHTGSFCARVGTSVWNRSYYVIALSPELRTILSSGEWVCDFSYWQAGYTSDTDSGGMVVAFQPGTGAQSTTALSSFSAPMQTFGTNEWTQVQMLGMIVPPETTHIELNMAGRRASGTNNDVYFDDLGPLVFRHRGKRTSTLWSQAIGTGQSSWTNVVGTIGNTNSQLGIQYQRWASASLGHSYRDQVITDVDMLARIDAAEITLEIQGSFCGWFDQPDVGRMYVEFYDQTSALIGSRIWSHDTEWKAPPMGLGYLGAWAVPPLTRSVRIGLVGTRGDSSGNLDFGFMGGVWVGLTQTI